MKLSILIFLQILVSTSYGFIRDISILKDTTKFIPTVFTNCDSFNDNLSNLNFYGNVYFENFKEGSSDYYAIKLSKSGSNVFSYTSRGNKLTNIGFELEQCSRNIIYFKNKKVSTNLLEVGIRQARFFQPKLEFVQPYTSKLPNSSLFAKPEVIESFESCSEFQKYFDRKDIIPFESSENYFKISNNFGNNQLFGININEEILGEELKEDIFVAVKQPNGHESFYKGLAFYSGCEDNKLKFAVHPFGSREQQKIVDKFFMLRNLRFFDNRELDKVSTTLTVTLEDLKHDPYKKYSVTKCDDYDKFFSGKSGVFFSHHLSLYHMSYINGKLYLYTKSFTAQSNWELSSDYYYFDKCYGSQLIFKSESKPDKTFNLANLDIYYRESDKVTTILTVTYEDLQHDPYRKYKVSSCKDYAKFSSRIREVFFSHRLDLYYMSYINDKLYLYNKLHTQRNWELSSGYYYFDKCEDEQKRLIFKSKSESVKDFSLVDLDFYCKRVGECTRGKKCLDTIDCILLK